jgi:hypothetical protein
MNVANNRRRIARYRLPMNLPSSVPNLRLADQPLSIPTSEHPFFARYKLLSGFGRCQPVSNNWEVLAGF